MQDIQTQQIILYSYPKLSLSYELHANQWRNNHIKRVWTKSGSPEVPEAPNFSTKNKSRTF